jgi:rhodanese-related sulfurtransferase
MTAARRGPLVGLAIALPLSLMLALPACDRPPHEGSSPRAQEVDGSELYRGSTAQGSFRQVKPAGVASPKKAVRVVDVREPSEFNDELGHIPGAELVPLGTLGARAASWDREEELVVVCRSGARSRRAASTLAGMGFRRVMDMEGGMRAYSAARLPVERK